MHEGRDLFLVQTQSANGTPESDLVGTADYFPALRDGSSMESAPEFTEVDEVSSEFDQRPSVLGAVGVSGNLACYMRSLGTATAPDFGKLLKAAGLKETATPMGENGNKYSYAQASDFGHSELTVYKYDGGIGSNGSVLTIGGNIAGDWKITFEANKPVRCELVGYKGVFVSNAVGTLPSEITKPTNRYPAFQAATVSINGVTTYKLIKAIFEGGVSAEQHLDPVQTRGYAGHEIGQKKGKFSLQIYADPALALPSTAVLADAVESAIALTWGTHATDKIQQNLTVTYPQFTMWKESKVGSLIVYDISGILTRNNVTVTVNNDLVA